MLLRVICEDGMEKHFFILFTFRTPKGFAPFARFEVGNDREAAGQLFNLMHGNTEVSEQDPLYVELMETTAGLPQNLRLKSCTLAELCENCRLITKQVFRINVLEQ